MPFNWQEYLSLAASIIAQPSAAYSQEAAERCAVSRAYYAAFRHARNYAEHNLNYVPAHDSSDHWRIRDHFRHRGLHVIAARLGTMHRWRTQCDYDDNVPNIAIMARSAITTARRVISAL